MNNITVGKVRRSLQRFSDYSGDLLRSDMNTFDDRLSLLMDYCRSDEIFGVIDSQLKEVANVDFNSWYTERLATRKGMVGSADLIFPTDIDERMSIMYQLMSKIRSGEVDFSSFTHNFFASGNSTFDSEIYAFNDAIVEPLRRELSYRFQDLEDSLPKNEREFIPLGAVQIIHNAKNVVQQSASGGHVTQDVSIVDNSELDQKFADLRRELESTIDDHSNRAKYLEVVDSAQSLVAGKEPKKTAAETLLKTLPTAGNIGSLVSVILSAIALMG